MKTPKIAGKWEMGEKVTIRRFLVKTRKGNATLWEPSSISCPRSGWVVGSRVVYCGHMHSEFSLDYSEYYFVHDSSLHVVLVSFWPDLKSVYVLPEDILPFDESAHFAKYSKQVSVEASKTYYYYGGYPRDEKGRFIPETQSS